MHIEHIQRATKPNILIGTPVHEVKDYCFKEWLISVRDLMNFNNFDGKFDLLLVDNSQNMEYQEKVRQFCGELGITNCKIIHLDLYIYDNGEVKHDRKNSQERIAYCREEMNKELMQGNYNHLFFWESDVILPPDAFERLIEFDDKFDVIMHDYPSREDPTEEAWGFGCTIIKRKWFEGFSFLYECENYHGGESRLLKRIRLAGGHWVEFHNFLDIKHRTNI